MARPHPLKELMKTPLPSITEQRRKCYRPSLREINETYKLINKYVFNNKLKRPPIQLKSCRKYWGMCIGSLQEVSPGTFCKIELMDKWFCIQWMITTLAHEMVHQYEWDVLRKDMTHRQSFFIWREKLAEFNINLKTSHGQKRWFKYQDFTKC
ncbi:MAG: SprT-like family [Bacteroidota bacterium]|jgi:hypothetical protein